MSGQTNWALSTQPENASRTSSWLTSEIEARILDGELTPGARLPSERRLSAWSGISRPAVREALRVLTARGYLEVMPGSGAYVRDVSMADAAQPLERLFWRRSTPRQVVEARRMLEAQSAALAATRADEADLAAMDAAITRFDHGSDPLVQARHDLAFHLAVVRAAHNPVLEAMFASISRLTIELMVRSLADPSISRAGVPYHRHIVDAIRDHDADAARAAVVGHLRVAEQLYGDDFDEPLDDLARREAQRIFGSELSLEQLLTSLDPGPLGDEPRDAE